MTQPITITRAFKLPWPPSVNAYWRAVNGRNILSEKGRRYKVAASDAVLLAGFPKHRGPCRVIITLHPPDKRRRDCDNSLKPILDALVANQVIDGDDWQTVRGITVDWHDPVIEAYAMIDIIPALGLDGSQMPG